MFHQSFGRAAIALALGFVVGVGSASTAFGQNDVANRYAVGAGYFAAGRLDQAASEFDQAIAAKTDDPRAYFLRGLCAARLGDAATADGFYAEGARVELATAKGRLSNVDETLATVQGSEREPIEAARNAARAAWKANEEARQQAVYGESLARQRARLAQPSAAEDAAPKAAGTAAGAKTAALAAPSIRPFGREEIPANRPADLYDPQSTEFNYLREELGKTELSTRAKERLERLASRTTYVDPMDKPAADGSPFVNIFDLDEVYADDEPFVGDDDPDVLYEADEKNALDAIATACKLGTTAIQLKTASSAKSQDASKGGMYGDMYGSMSGDPTGMYGSMSGDPTGMYDDGKSGSASKKEKEEAKPVEPSEEDDTNLLFADPKPAASAVEKGFEFDAANDFDFFKADREFKATADPKAAAQANGGYMGSGSPSGMMGSPSGMMGSPSGTPSSGGVSGAPTK